MFSRSAINQLVRFDRRFVGFGGSGVLKIDYWIADINMCFLMSDIQYGTRSHD